MTRSRKGAVGMYRKYLYATSFCLSFFYSYTMGSSLDLLHKEIGKKRLLLESCNLLLRSNKESIHKGQKVIAYLLRNADTTMRLYFIRLLKVMSDQPCSLGTCLEVPGPDGLPMLHWASYTGNMEAVELLVFFKAYTEERDLNGLTALHYALINRHEAIARFLVKSGADVAALTKEGDTPLSLAQKSDLSSELASYLRKVGGYLNVCNKSNTLLHYAVGTGDEELVLKVLARGDEDIERVGEWDHTPLSKAIELGFVSIVQLLLQKGASPNNSRFQRAGLGGEPLFQAIRAGNHEIVSLLLEYGALPNIAINDGDTVLHAAVRKGNLAIVKELLEHGADRTIQNFNKLTPLDYAFLGGYKEILNLLLRYNDNQPASNDYADTLLKHANRSETTLLHVAVESGNTELVRRILALGVYHPIKDVRGKLLLILHLNKAIKRC